MLFKPTPATPIGESHRHAKTVKALWVGLLALLVLRILYLQFSEIGVFYDEAYYRFWSVTPDWGYYSKPPMVAWSIALSNQLFGFMPEWTTKIGAPLFYFGTTVVLYDLSKRLFDGKTAVYAALIFFTMPLVSFNSLFITTDAPLVFFWSLTLWLFVLAVQQDRIYLWVLAGAAGGLGMLSKYTMGVLAVAVLLFIIRQKDYRALLTRPGLWLAVVIAAMVFSPNLIWNANHEFISFQHTSEISKLDESLVHPEKFLEFFGGQFFVFGPIAFWLLLRAFFSNANHSNQKLLLFVAIAMLGVISLQAFLAHAHVNWAAPAYITGSILVAYYLAHQYKKKLLRWLVSINLLLAAAFYFYSPMQSALGIEPTKKNNPFQRIEGWREVTLKLKSYAPEPEKVIWLSDSRKLLSYLHFYLSDLENAKAIQLRSFNPSGYVGDQFDLMWDLAKDPKNDEQEYLFISEYPKPIENCFQQTDYLGEATEQVYPTLQRHIHVYRVRGFKGYDQCLNK